MLSSFYTAYRYISHHFLESERRAAQMIQKRLPESTLSTYQRPRIYIIIKCLSWYRGQHICRAYSAASVPASVQRGHFSFPPSPQCTYHRDTKGASSRSSSFALSSLLSSSLALQLNECTQARFPWSVLQPNFCALQIHRVFSQVKQRHFGQSGQRVHFDFFQSNSPDTKTPAVKRLEIPRRFETSPFIPLLAFAKQKNHPLFPYDRQITVVVFHVVVTKNER